MSELNLRPDYRSRLSAALKVKWASGTRKPTPESAHKKAGLAIRQRYAEGRVKQRDPELVKIWASKGGRTVTQKKIDVNRRIAERRRGALNPKGPSARGPGHWKSKWWAFKSPTGIVLSGKNLNRLVREHTHLFAPEDVVWKKSQCRASNGLHQLVCNSKRNPTTWKGWIALGWIPPSSAKALLAPFSPSELLEVEAE